MDMLARFRADPKKVRVSIRRSGEGWTVAVKSRLTAAPTVLVLGNDPDSLLSGALAVASEAGIPGVDIDMQWAYRHPQLIGAAET